MTEQEFEILLAMGHETNGVEFKGPGARTQSSFLARVIKAILGMANRRDGGLVILGVEDKELEPIGLSEEVLETWAYDKLMTDVNEYASPSVNFDLETLVFQENRILIIRVHEFDEVPVLCAKPLGVPEKKGELILRKGACYVRSRHKPETTEIPSEEEMRELLELAIDKGVRRFILRAQKAGLFPSPPFIPAKPSDEEQFRQKIEDME